MSFLATREAYGEALVSLADKYEFLVLDADLSKATQTNRFLKKYPERFFNMGISEGDMMTTAAGIATTGKAVFASTFAMFATGRAYEQIRNSIAYPKLNVKIAATHGGLLIGEDGASHQCIEDISLMRTLPNMTVIVPADMYTVELAVKAALDYEGPVYLRFGRKSPAPVYTADTAKFEIGKGNLLKDGKDVTIIAIGDMVAQAVIAAEELAKEGVEAAVIDMASIKPIDADMIREYAAKTGKIITAEDHNIIGGLGSAVAEVISEAGNCAMRRVGVMDTFGESGTPNELAEKYGLTAKDIVKAYKTF